MDTENLIHTTQKPIAATTPVEEVVASGSGGLIFPGVMTHTGFFDNNQVTDLGPFSYQNGSHLPDVFADANTGGFQPGYWPNGPAPGVGGSVVTFSSANVWSISLVMWLRATDATDNFGRQTAYFQWDNLNGAFFDFRTNNGDIYDWYTDATWVDQWGERVGYYDGGDPSDREELHQQAVTSPVPADGEWHLLIATYGDWSTKGSPDFSISGTLRIYVDGSLAVTKSVPYHIPSDYLTYPQGGFTNLPYTQPWYMDSNEVQLTFSTNYMDSRGAAYYAFKLTDSEVASIWAAGPPAFDSDGSDTGASTMLGLDPAAFWVFGPSLWGYHDIGYVDFEVENDTDAVMLRGMVTFQATIGDDEHDILFHIGRDWLDGPTDMSNAVYLQVNRGGPSGYITQTRTAHPMQLIEPAGIDVNGNALTDQLEPGHVYRAYLSVYIPSTYTTSISILSSVAMAFVGETGVHHKQAAS